MAKENQLFAERLALVDSPDEYYTVVAYLDLIEFLFYLHKTKMMDTKLWPRWKALAETLMDMPKFRKVSDKTKHVHNSDIIEFMDSLWTDRSLPSSVTHFQIAQLYYLHHSYCTFNISTIAVET
jgi:hypothetical protein